MILKPNEIKPKVDGFLDLVRQRNGLEPEFLQAVEEVAETVIPYIIQNDIYVIPYTTNIWFAKLNG